MRDTYSVPFRTMLFMLTSYEDSGSKRTRKSIEFWCGGFHLYTLRHVRPFVSAGGATGESRGVNTRPSVLYSKSIVRILAIDSSIAALSPARKVLVSMRITSPGATAKDVPISITNLRAHPRRDAIGFLRISSSVVKSGSPFVVLPRYL